MKNRFSFALVATLVFALLLPVFVFAQQGATPNRGDGTSSVTPPPPAPARRAAPRAGSGATAAVGQDFAEALTLIQENYVDGNNLDYNNVFKSSIIGMLRSLDPHSNYYDRREFDELRSDQRSEYSGIGASIRNQRIGEELDTFIVATFENAPAWRAGLRYGDRILEVDGQPIRGKSSAEVRDRLRGPRGTTVRVKIERAATGQAEVVEITRDVVPQPSIPDAYLLRPGVGYVDMQNGFNFATADELQAKLEELRQRGMTSLVLDLRNNPGGFLDQAIRVADRFLQRGQVILSQRGRARNTERTYVAQNGSPDTIPLVILINGGSASASEIVAGAMQDHDRAMIVGETSFGKGLVQSIISLEYGAGLTLTSAKYYTPSGRLIQRDYSNGSLYDYYTRGGTNRLEQERQRAQPQQPAAPPRPAGQETRTDTGRVVYGGGGITPDEQIRTRTLTPAQTRLIDPIFGFTRELVNGRVNGFDAYRVARGIDYRRELQATDYPITDAVFNAFKAYVAANPSYRTTAAQLDRNREFIARQLRFEIVTAAFGSVAATRVLASDDPQVLGGINALPRARELAEASYRGRNPPQRTYDE